MLKTLKDGTLKGHKWLGNNNPKQMEKRTAVRNGRKGGSGSTGVPNLELRDQEEGVTHL